MILVVEAMGSISFISWLYKMRPLARSTKTAPWAATSGASWAQAHPLYTNSRIAQSTSV